MGTYRVMSFGLVHGPLCGKYFIISILRIAANLLCIFSFYLIYGVYI